MTPLCNSLLKFGTLVQISLEFLIVEGAKFIYKLFDLVRRPLIDLFHARVVDIHDL